MAPPSTPHRTRAEEARSAVAELREYFAEADILEAMAAAPRPQGEVNAPVDDVTRERILDALRAFSVLVIESTYPRMAAQMVGKLVKLELATGKRLTLEQIGRTIGVSKQAVSKQLAEYARRLGIERPDSTPQARESHRLMNRRNFNRGRHAVPARETTMGRGG